MPQQLPATHSVATGHMREQWPLHGDAYQRRFQAEVNSLAAWKWVVDISAFQHGVYYTCYTCIIHSRLCWNLLFCNPRKLGHINTNWKYACSVTRCQPYWQLYDTQDTRSEEVQWYR